MIAADKILTSHRGQDKVYKIPDLDIHCYQTFIVIIVFNLSWICLVLCCRTSHGCFIQNVLLGAMPRLEVGDAMWAYFVTSKIMFNKRICAHQNCKLEMQHFSDLCGLQNILKQRMDKSILS